MRKFYSLVLIAAGLLVSTCMWASVPERPYHPEIGLDGMAIKAPVRSQSVKDTPMPDFSKSPARAAKKVAAGVKVAKNINTGAEYEDLNVAIESATAGDSLVVLNDVEGVVVINNNISLNLNDHSITSTELNAMQINADAKIYNGTIIEDSEDPTKDIHEEIMVYAIYIKGGNVILTDIDVTSSKYIESGKLEDAPNKAITIEKGELTINSGTYLASSGCIYTGDKSDAKTVTILGGTLLGYYECIKDWNAGKTSTFNIGGDAQLIAETDATIYAYGGIVNVSGNALLEAKPESAYPYALYSGGGGNFSITGGTLRSAGAAIGLSTNGVISGGYFDAPTAIVTYGGKPSITGGTFTSKVLKTNTGTFDVANGYAFFENADGKFEVHRAIAQLNGKGYYSLQAAIDVAQDGDEIYLDSKLLADAWEETITVTGKMITINNNGKTLVLDGSITVEEGATLMLTGNGKIDAQLTTPVGGTLAIYGGTYTFNPTNYAPSAEGCIVIDNKNGTWTVKQEMATIVGKESTKYTSLAEAVSAATSGETVKLLYDYTLPGTVDLAKNGVIIDLDGKTIYAANSTKSYLNIKGNITIQNGTIKNGNVATTYPNALLNIATEGKTLTLNGVNVTNKGSYAVQNAAAASLDVQAGCQLDGAKAEVYASNTLTLTNNIALGEVLLADVVADITNNSGATMSLNTSVENKQAITITNSGIITVDGGIYMGTITAGQVTLNAGIFAPAIKNAYPFEDGASKKWNEIKYLGEQAFEVVDKSASMECEIVGGFSYASLKQAIEYLPENAEVTVKVLDNIEIDEEVATYITVNNEKKITLDLNGMSISATKVGTLFSLSNATLTIDDNSDDKDGLITLLNEESSASYTIAGGKGSVLIINNGTIQNTSNEGAAYAVQVSTGGQMTLYGGMIEQTSGCAVRVIPYANSETPTTLTIEGGLVKSPVQAILVHNMSANAYANVTINGGHIWATNTSGDDRAFYVYSNGQNYENINITINKGLFTGDVELGGGAPLGGKYYENASIKGGTFETNSAFNTRSRSAETKLYYIEGGAYYFANTATTNADFLRFCEYIKPGHYAVKMCRDDENGEYSTPNIEGKYNFGECEDGSFWAVISPYQDKGGVKTISSTETLSSMDNEHQDLVVTGEGTIVTLGDDIEMNRLIVEKGAKVIVPTDVTLTIGYNGVVVGDDEKTTTIEVEPGGTFLCNGTLVSSKVEEIIVNVDEEHGSGVVLVAPDVDYNQHPKITINLLTNVGKEVNQIVTGGTQTDWYWQRFGIPVMKMISMSIKDEDNQPLTYEQCPTDLRAWDYDKENWVPVTSLNQFKPFEGYSISHTLDRQLITYVFTGELVGNVDWKLDFHEVGYNFFSNSYLGYADAKEMLTSIMENPDVEGTVWIWNVNDQKCNYVTMADAMDDGGEFKEVAPMQTYILRQRSGENASIDMSYEKAVWRNPQRFVNVEMENDKVPARMMASADNTAKIILTTANGVSDCLGLRENEQYSDMFDNGADASKYMNTNGLNLYVATSDGNRAALATDNLEGTMLTMQTNGEINYTISFKSVRGKQFVLRDNMTGIETLMEEGRTYSFVAQPNTTIDGRFEIVAPRMTPTNTGELKANAQKKGIFTVMGQYVGQTSDWHKLPKGIYVVDGVRIAK